MTRNVAVAVGLSILLGLSGVASAGETALKAIKTIVLGKKPALCQRLAAEDLKYHLQKIAGTEIALAAEPGDGPAVYVGPEAARMAGLDPDAMNLTPEEAVLRTTPKGLVLFGDDAQASRSGHATSGTRHAVSLFLEKHCGVAWLWPGESGEVIPANPELTVPDLDLREAPSFRKRELTFYYARYWKDATRKDLGLWQARSRLGDTLRGWYGHSWGRYIPEKVYFEKHPDWFAEVNGKRIPAQLCTSNPELREEFLRRVLAEPINKRNDIWSISANDGSGFCRCDLCKAMGSVADAYWDFAAWVAGEVAKRAPGKNIGSFAYTMYRQPPAKIDKLPPNVYLSMTTYAATFSDPEKKAEYTDFVKAWKSKGVKIVMREYWGMHYWLDLPVLQTKHIAHEMKFGHAAGMIGAYGEAGKNFSTQGPNYYLVTQLAWDADQDPDAALARYYERGFGPAAPHVRAYFDGLEKTVGEAWPRLGLVCGYVKLVQNWHKVFTEKSLDEAAAHLAAACKAAQGRPDVLGRLDFLAIGLEYTRVMSALIERYDNLGRTGFPLEFFEWEATAVATRKHLRTADIPVDESWELRHKEPFAYTIAQKDQWLKDAWELGQKRIALYNANLGGFALDEGLYAITLRARMRQWHQTVAKYMGKDEKNIAPLDYTGADKWGDR